MPYLLPSLAPFPPFTGGAPLLYWQCSSRRRGRRAAGYAASSRRLDGRCRGSPATERWQRLWARGGASGEEGGRGEEERLDSRSKTLPDYQRRRPFDFLCFSFAFWILLLMFCYLVCPATKGIQRSSINLLSSSPSTTNEE